MMKKSLTGKEIFTYCIAMLVMFVGMEKAESATLSVPTTEYPSIQSAIDAASDGDVIVVASGTYGEAINFSGLAITLYGIARPTIDATGLNKSAVTCANSEGPDTILDGFTITGGSYSNGGGMRNYASNPTVINCTFSGNTAYSGGGMYNLFSSPTVSDCTFSANIATDYGGGMFNSYSSPNVTRCTFIANIANDYGAGMHNSNSSPHVTGCSFIANLADWYGGGMYNAYSSNPNVTNCTFSTNTGILRGGGMYNAYSSNPRVTNCTFSLNTAGLGGGMYNLTSNPIVTNCILWDNSPDEIFGIATVSYSDVLGGNAVEGNINQDPMFVDADSGDLHLLADSPCIDTGSNDAVPSGITTDLDGNPRITGTYVDMGAYEFTEELTDPFEQVLLLITDVVNLNTQQGIVNSLDAKLSAVLQALDDMNENNDVAAINALGAFINAVEAQSGNKISVTDAEYLSGVALSIIDILLNGI